MMSLRKLAISHELFLFAKEFRPEVTATSLWLRKFGADITCIKLVPYKIDEDKIGVVATKIIPIHAAEEFMINAERKEIGERALTRAQEENYLKTTLRCLSI